MDLQQYIASLDKGQEFGVREMMEAGMQVSSSDIIKLNALSNRKNSIIGKVQSGNRYRPARWRKLV